MAFLYIDTINHTVLATGDIFECLYFGLFLASFELHFFDCLKYVLIARRIKLAPNANQSIKSRNAILEQLRQTNKHLHKINKKIKISKHQQSRTKAVK